LRESKGWTLERAAEAMGMSYGGYYKLERNERRLHGEYIAKAAQVFSVPESVVISDKATVRVVGSVRAGGHVETGASLQNIRTAPCPPASTPETVALIVEGDVMPSVAKDGWLLYHEELVDGMPDEWIGKVCRVQLSDGTDVIREIYHGRDPGTFDLISSGYAPVRGVKVERAAKITWSLQP
jgi:hypothetical protein